MAFAPSSLMRKAAAAPMVDLGGMVVREATIIASLPAAERTESKIADKLAALCRTLPQAMQMPFLSKAVEVIERCNLIVPDDAAPIELPAEFLTECKQRKAMWTRSMLENPITRMVQLHHWTWANAAEAEDELYPERKAEREVRAAAAAAAVAAEAEAAKAAEERKQRFIRDNRNPSLRPGNLYLGVTEADMRAVFAPFGTLTRVNVPKCRDTGNTRGFAFVDFASPQDAARAYLALNDAPRMVGNQMMRVEFASSEQRPARSGGAAAAPYRRK